jgi:hypothetical protein
LVGVNNYRDDDLAGCAERGWIAAGNAALTFKLLQYFRAHVACVGAESSPQERACDSQAHGTQTDDSN